MKNKVTKDILRMVENFLFKNGWTIEYMSQRFSVPLIKKITDEHGNTRTVINGISFTEVRNKSGLLLEGTTTCVIRKGDTKVIGRSYCSSMDNYNRAIGKYVALKRAIAVADIKKRRRMMLAPEIVVLEDGRYNPKMFLADGDVSKIREAVLTGEQVGKKEMELEVNY